MEDQVVALLLGAILTLCIAHRVESTGSFVLNVPGQTVKGVEGPYGMPGDRFVARIGFGSDNMQGLKISFDTSFNGLFVPMKKGEQSGNLHFEQGFDDSNSEVVREDSLDYLNTTLSGRWVADTLSLDLSAKKEGSYKFNGVFFVANASSKNLLAEPYSGIFGLGPQDVGKNNLLLSLKEQGVIKKAQFGLWFSPPWMKNKQMQLILGDLDTKRASDMSIIPNISRKYWQVHLSSVYLMRKHIGCAFGNCKAIMNSGSSATYGPRKQVMQLYEELGIDTSKNITNTYVNCDTVPRDLDLKFTFWARDRIFPSQYYIEEIYDEKTSVRTCHVTIYPNDSDLFWYMGTNFLAAYYTAYDLESSDLLIAH